MDETRIAFPYSDGEDRISRLQDDLIHHILSFIDTNYAVQTSVLSKRRIDIWKSQPFLKFYTSMFSNIIKFIDFVDMVFIFRGDTDIQLFLVEWVNSPADDDMVTMNVHRWIAHAIKYNAQEIRILKVLCLDGLSISDVESSKRLFSSCPVLETLDMIDCDIQTDNQSRKLIVDSLSLKKFYYSDHCHLGQNNTTDNIIKLCAPNLEDFTLKSLLRQYYSLESSFPLSGLTFDMTISTNKEDENAETYENLPPEEIKVYAKRMMQFLGAAYMVQGMRLSSGFLEVVSQAPDLLDCQHPRLYNLRSLTLEMWSTRGCFMAIACILEICPNIDTMYIESIESNVSSVVSDVWEVGLSSIGKSSRLNSVQIEEVEGCDADLRILSFLFRNAKYLKRVIIYFRSSVGTPDKGKQVEQFKDMLRAVPTASSSIELVFY
ncbi:putative F-box/FBD/LRR-repeat protein At1g78760 [Papaver somniferum]|uniref:putative F-box/FBD/LRR-repeat protein At1g78760 n=1 Tax=Papaver somniferum TaxID=3469 RepID=UPI000E704A68|nr:putative F-box/FBD/LRR-repeat protein At1g78760 [Papaver somniferum]